EREVLSHALASEDRPGVLHFALVGTRPTARGRGLARAVLGRSLAAAAASGYGSAELEVDSESLTGATRLYEALGFTAEKVFATYQKMADQHARTRVEASERSATTTDTSLPAWSRPPIPTARRGAP